MTLSELIATIHKEIDKRGFLHENTPANKVLFNQKCAGTYEAVLTGHGNEKFLIPQVGTLHFLFGRVAFTNWPWSDDCAGFSYSAP